MSECNLTFQHAPHGSPGDWWCVGAAKPAVCVVCQEERWTVEDGLCQTCRFVAHCEGY